jgi:hypothetical protein
VQVEDDNGQPSCGRDGSKQQPSALDRAQVVVVRGSHCHTIGSTLNASRVSIRGGDGCSKDGSGDGGKQDQVGRMLQLVRQDNVGNRKNECQTSRHTLENIRNKESIVQSPWLVERVGLRARQAASTSAERIIRVLSTICRMEHSVNHEWSRTLGHWGCASRVAALDDRELQNKENV